MEGPLGQNSIAWVTLLQGFPSGGRVLPFQRAHSGACPGGLSDFVIVLEFSCSALKAANALQDCKIGEGMEGSTLIGTSVFMGKEEAACV